MKKLLWLATLALSLVGCEKQTSDTGAPASADGGSTGGTLSTNPPGGLPGTTNTPANPAGATGGNTPGGAPKAANP